MTTRSIAWLFVCLVLLAACGVPAGPAAAPALAPAEPASTQTSTPPGPTPGGEATGESAPAGRLDVRIYYPGEDSELKTGQPVKFTLQIFDDRGQALTDASVTVTVRDPGGRTVAQVPAVAGRGDVYRSEHWPIPHGAAEGRWGMVVEARRASARGTAAGVFSVKNSAGDTLLSKYGFWLDAPTLGGVVPQLCGEKGDARNGKICWGGQRIQGHILPANWLDIQWREGDYGLDSPEAVRRFMLGELGYLGFTPIRNIGPFEPVKFKHWDAWRVGGQGRVNYDQVQWMIFYAPEVDKTYSIGTTVVLPPRGVNPHEELRKSFAVFPEIQAAGIAPEPLPGLLPAPELLSPPLGASFQGPDASIVLEWEPLKELGDDEFYEVVVDYDYREGNFPVRFATRETHITLPDSLYHTPNCHVFNWQATLKRQTGVDDAGQPQGEPISYSSLYWYLWWLYPAGEEKPFTGTCPNAQF